MRSEALARPAAPSGWTRAMQRLLVMVLGWRRRPRRKLRLCETLALGERRFLAVVEFERQRFLIGGTASSVALLSRLSARPEAAPPAEN